MVQQGVVVAKTLRAEQLFVIQRTVGFAELSVAFLRDFSERMVMHELDIRIQGKVSRYTGDF